MIVVIQRVSQAEVKINGLIKGQIGLGLMILVGIEEADSQEDIDWLTTKITKLRIFPDEKGVMNLDLMQMNADILLISQFTLHASTKKGNRPSYIKAAPPAVAIPLYERFISSLEKEMGKSIQTGEFGADMKVSLTNDGPVTILMDSKNKV
jgi:D-tyrosyl-tRNA(Tyr) deacylase